MMATCQAGRSELLPGQPALTQRQHLLSRAAHVLAALAGALAMLIVFTGLALAAAGDAGRGGPVESIDKVQDVRMALIRTPMDARRCVTDVGWRACLYGVTPQLTGIGPEARAAASGDRAERIATVVLLFAALFGSLALVVLFWRHLASAVALTDRPADTDRTSTRR